MKKIIIVLFSFLLVFNIVSVYPLKASAASAVVDSPGFQEEAYKALVNGIIATSALGVGVYDAVTPEFEDVKKEALASYEMLSPHVKESWRQSLIQAQTLPGLYVDSSNVIWDSLKTTVTGILQKKSVETYGANGGYTLTRYGSNVFFQFNTAIPLKIDYVNFEDDFYTADYLNFNIYRSSGVVTQLSAKYTSGGALSSDFFNTTQEQYESLLARIENISTPIGLINLINSYSTQATYSLNFPTDAIYDPTLKRALENDIPWMKDAGLVLPMPEAYHPTTNQRINVNDSTGAMTLPDGSIYQGDVTWKSPGITTGLDTLGNPAIGWTGTNVTTGQSTWTNIKTGETVKTGEGTGTTPPGTTPPKDTTPGTNPFKNIVPLALLLGLFDLLVAVIWYLIRMFHFIVTIGFIRETQITNPYFLWFRDLTILGIKPYSMTINLAIFFLGFSIYKSIRRVFG